MLGRICQNLAASFGYLGTIILVRGILSLCNELLMSQLLDWTLSSILSYFLQALICSILLLILLLTALLTASIRLIHLSRSSLIIIAMVRRLHVILATSSIKYLVVSSPKCIIISIIVDWCCLVWDMCWSGMCSARTRPTYIRWRRSSILLHYERCVGL